MLRRHALTSLAATLLVGSATLALAAAPVLNLYSARHYQTDEALYEDFTQGHRRCASTASTVTTTASCRA